MKVCDKVVSSEQPERCGIYSFDVAGQVGAVVNQSGCREWCEADVRCNYYAFWSIGWCADDHPSTRAYCIRRLRQSPVRGDTLHCCAVCNPHFFGWPASCVPWWQVRNVAHLPIQGAAAKSHNQHC
eukprot:3088844-Prymnesium_polylepis.1